MAALEYAIGIIAGIVEAVITIPCLAAANSLSLNVIEYGSKFYQVLPSPLRELSWTESHSASVGEHEGSRDSSGYDNDLADFHFLG